MNQLEFAQPQSNSSKLHFSSF